MKPHEHTVSSLIKCETEHPLFKIPKYQRPYTWGTVDCEKIFDDVDDNDKGYFIGSIICINRTTSDGTAIDYEVIDGQQRLTSISLLLLAICVRLKDYEASFTQAQLNKYYNLRLRLVTEQHHLKLTPQSQGHNLDDYKAILNENGFSEVVAPAGLSHVGNRRLKKNYLVFCKKLQSALDEVEDKTDSSRLIYLLDFLEKVYAAEIILITAEKESEAYKLFESLNNTGVPLTPMDLLKNNLLSSASGEPDQTVDGYYAKWENVIKYLTDDYSKQERFLRHYYNAFRYTLNQPFKTEALTLPLGSMARKSNLLEIYPQMIKHDSKSFIGDLEEKAKYYSAIISNDTVSDEAVSPLLRESYQKLNNLGAAPSHMLLLYLESNRGRLMLDDVMLSEIVDLLVKFFVRRNLNDVPATRDLDRIMMRIIEGLEGKTVCNIYECICEQLIPTLSNESFSCEENFIKKLSGPIYDDNTGVARFVLSYLEAEHFTKKEDNPDLWSYSDKGRLAWTIEHIFPEGEKIKPYWVKMIADGDEALAIQYREKYVHLLGNLTLTGYNSNLSDSKFADKRDKTDENGTPIGYKNGLWLNGDVAFSNPEKTVIRDRWTTAEIKGRHYKLVKAAVELFSLDMDLPDEEMEGILEQHWK